MDRHRMLPIKGIEGVGRKVLQVGRQPPGADETRISTAAESEYSYACATIYGDGTYALLSWIADVSLLPGNGSDSSTCDFKITNFGNIMSDMIWDGDNFTAALIGVGFQSTGDLVGLPVTVTFLLATCSLATGVTGLGSCTTSSGGY